MYHSILAGIGEIRYDKANAMGAGTAEGIQIEQQLHQAFVDWPGTGLDEEDILIAHDLIDHDVGFAIREMVSDATPNLCVELSSNFICQSAMGGTRENTEWMIGRESNLS